MKNKFYHKDFRPEFMNNPRDEYSKQMSKIESTEEDEGLKADILKYFEQDVNKATSKPRTGQQRMRQPGLTKKGSVLKHDQECSVRGRPTGIASTPKAVQANAELMTNSGQSKTE